MRAIVLSLVLLLATGPTYALEVFVNNKPFTGVFTGSPDDLSLEVGALMKLVEGDYQVSESSLTTPAGATLKLSPQQGVKLVKARELVKSVGGKYNYSAALGTVDIYAFDQLGRARERLKSVVALPRITNLLDFQVLSLLAREYLVKELKMTFQPPIRRMDLVSKDEWAAEGGPGNSAGFARTSAADGDRVQYDFFFQNNNTPFETIRLLGWVWGANWALSQGCENQVLVRGAGEWTSYKLLSKLTGDMPSETVFSTTDTYDGPGAEAARELVRLEKDGGVEAVLNRLRR